MNAKTFEEIQLWKDSRKFVNSIYQITSNEKFKYDFGFKDQIQRAALSVMNNIAEGFERENNKEFVRFLRYSKGSAGEVRSMLYICLDLNYISKEEFDNCFNNSLNIISQISNFIKYLNKFLPEK